MKVDQWVTITDGELDKVDLLVTQAVKKELLHRRRQKIREIILTKWREAAIRRVDDPPGRRRLERYLKAMRVEFDDESVTLVLKGTEASYIELGWAPPDGPTDDPMSAGIGKYTGGLKDMRSFLLDKGEGYKRINMPLRLNRGDVRAKLLADTLPVMKAGLMTPYRRKKRIEQFMRGVDNLHKPPGSNEHPDDISEWSVKDKPKHVKPMLNAITRTTMADGKRGWVFSTWRTITRGANQHRRKLWYTEGVPPANVFAEEAESIVADAVTGA